MRYDYAIIGAGMAGVTLAAELAGDASVVLLDAEDAAGYHATGRSAALFTPNFGGEVVCAINRVSQSFYEHPPPALTERPLLSPRGILSVAPPGREDLLDAVLTLGTERNPVHRIDAERVLQLVPFLRRESAGAGAYEPGATAIDVDALLQACLRRCQTQAVAICYRARVTALTRRSDHWHIDTEGGDLSATVVINAAGAWAGEIGALAGAVPVALVPKRRTAIIVDAPAGVDVSALPAVDSASEHCYFKPDAGRLMVSLGEETPTAACDAQPEELDVALIVDWLERVTTIDVKRVTHRWAGLRSFVPDLVPVVGPDPQAPGFFWLAGQGGYGIMMAPTLARITSDLLRDNGLAEDIAAAGVSLAALRPDRPGAAAG